jgi:hypothetical protein
MDSFDEDYLTGTDSSHFLRQPKAQEDEIDELQKDVFDNRPLLNELLARMHDRIDFYNSNESIPDSVLKDPEVFMHTVHGNKIAARNAEQDFIWLKSILEEFPDHER